MFGGNLLLGPCQRGILATGEVGEIRKTDIGPFNPAIAARRRRERPTQVAYASGLDAPCEVLLIWNSKAVTCPAVEHVAHVSTLPFSVLSSAWASTSSEVSGPGLEVRCQFLSDFALADSDCIGRNFYDASF